MHFNLFSNVSNWISASSHIIAFVNVSRQKKKTKSKKKYLNCTLQSTLYLSSRGTLAIKFGLYRYGDSKEAGDDLVLKPDFKKLSLLHVLCCGVLTNRWNTKLSLLHACSLSQGSETSPLSVDSQEILKVCGNLHLCFLELKECVKSKNHTCGLLYNCLLVI